MDNTAFVTVIVLSYNQEEFVERTLRSLVFQTFRDFEVVYIDNNSKDKTFERGVAVLKQSGIRYFAEKAPENLGISQGLNYGLTKYATGKYVSALAGDDWWDMDNLLFKANFAKANPEVGMIHGNGYNYNDETDEMTLFHKTPSLSGWILKELLKGPSINPQGVLYKHELIRSLGYFDKSAKVEDRDLWYRLARVAPVGYVHKALTFYRIHGGNISRNLDYVREGNEYFFKKYEKEFPAEIREARLGQQQYFASYLANHQPSFKSLKFILKNYQPDWLYNKQIVKCLLNIARKKLK